MNNSLSSSVLGMGVRIPGYQTKEDLRLGNYAEESARDFRQSLTPDAMSARERRRAPMAVMLAMEVAQQACDQANVSGSDVTAVFTSAIGDADTMSQLYTTVNSDDKQVSPTVFHNSVHNAASGYWSIGNNCRQPVSFFSADAYSFPTALLESLLLASSQSKPVLMVVYDIASPEPLQHLHAVQDSFAMALLLGSSPDNESSAVNSRTLTANLINGSCQWPQCKRVVENSGLNALYDSNPSARALSLIDALQEPTVSELQLPLAEHCTLKLGISA